MLAFRYISLHYLKSFFIILSALVLFVVGFDTLGVADKPAFSANLLLIFLVYKAFYIIDILLPISLVFAMIMTKISLIKSNYLVALYSLGYTKRDVLRPFLVVSSVVVMIHIFLHTFASFSNAKELATNIQSYEGYHNPTRDLFFTYKEKYIYIARMDPLKKEAVDLRIFSVKDESLYEVIVAKKAMYVDDAWLIKDADLLVKPQDISFSSPGITTTKSNEIKVLDGFRPKILDQIYEGKVDFTIRDAIDSLIILNKEGVDNSNIKSSLYRIFIHPFYAPLIVIIMFFFVPISSRFFNVSLFGFVGALLSVASWGILYMFTELAIAKTLSPEVGIMMPIFILLLIALKQLRRYR